MLYRYLERDAVLDAFTDSDFHLGGTDAKGYQLGFDLGLSRGAWLRLQVSDSERDRPAAARHRRVAARPNGQF